MTIQHILIEETDIMSSNNYCIHFKKYQLTWIIATVIVNLMTLLLLFEPNPQNCTGVRRRHMEFNAESIQIIREMYFFCFGRRTSGKY